MNYKIGSLLAVLGLIACACKKDNQDNQVVSQKYIHKYGYAVSQEEWDQKNYPGQVISSLRNGITVTATYENNQLHGPCTFTYPNSQTVEKYVLYNHNVPVKEVLYAITGMPMQETVQLTQNRNSLTTWYSDGVPRSVEEYTNGELIEGQYFSQNNDLESQVEKGNGIRIIRDSRGVLVCKDLMQAGLIAKREAFYPSGVPESIANYFQGLLHGERKTFTEQGEPLSVEQWANGALHGVSTYYKNGTKELEISYFLGKKHGWENQFVDGVSLFHQIAWNNDMKHGPEIFFIQDGNKKVSWNYQNKEVSQHRFNELARFDELLSQPR